VHSGAVALLGPNGAGKSTLFGILSMKIMATQGSFWVGGFRSGDGGDPDDYRERLGVMPQNFNAFGGYTCTEFLRYVAWLRRYPIERVEGGVLRALRAVDLTGHATTRIKSLSGGTRQRLGLAQALVAEPAFLLLDEPTVGLDPEQRHQFLAHLNGVATTTSVLMTTHMVEDVAAFAREVIVLAQGRVVFAGTVNDFCQVPEGRKCTGGDVEAAYLRVVSSVTF
jgi:ABC-2 type transport system ATP-binding protein